MRAVWVAGLFLALTLAGCSEEAAPPEEPQDQDSFDDVEVEVSDDTGAIRGVVVNEAIIPVKGAKVQFTADGTPLEQMTDDQGRFAFSKVPPGTYFLTVSKINHEEVQTTVVVEAGVKDPPVLKVQINRLYEGNPYHEIFQWQGYFTCAYAIGVSSTCVNDYTRICSVSPPCCPGGCLPQITGVVDHREYITVLEANWQSIIVEMVWEPSLAGTSNGMGMTMSYHARVGASHSWGCGSGPSPFLCRRDYSQIGGEDDFPSKIPPEGIPDLFIFMSAASGNIALQQEFEIFHSEFFFGLPPDGWSFVKGDRDPFNDG